VPTRLRDGAALSVVKLLTWVSKRIGWGAVYPFEPALAFPELRGQDPFAREHEKLLSSDARAWAHDDQTSLGGQP
jgi:hypothetical protein